MAEKQPPTPSSETVRIDIDLLEKIRYICFHRRDARNKRIPVTQFVDGLIREQVEAIYAEEFARQTRPESKPAPSPTEQPQPRKRRKRGSPPSESDHPEE